MCQQLHDIIEHETNDLLFFHAVPAFYRVTPHKLGKKFKEMANSGVSKEEIGKQLSPGSLIRTAMLQGNLDDGLVIVSGSIGQIKSILSCKEIIEGFFDGIDL